MSVIIFFSASKKKMFCRNDVQAIDFLRKGSYAPARYRVCFSSHRPFAHSLFDSKIICFYAILYELFPFRRAKLHLF